MQEQNLKNHAKFVVGFHVVTFLFIIATFILSIIVIVSLGMSGITLLGLLISICLGFLFFFTRQFANKNQDRIIRAEENFRCFQLTGKTIDPRLTRSQIISLRFADNEEYASLSEKTISQNLGSKEIKQAIKQWRADHHRV